MRRHTHSHILGGPHTHCIVQNQIAQWIILFGACIVKLLHLDYGCRTLIYSGRSVCCLLFLQHFFTGYSDIPEPLGNTVQENVDIDAAFTFVDVLERFSFLTSVWLLYVVYMKVQLKNREPSWLSWWLECWCFVFHWYANAVSSGHKLGLPLCWNFLVYVNKTKLYQSRGCFGCCIKPTPITAVDEPSKGLRIQGQTVKKRSASDDFWSTSTYEMDNSAVQSQRSMSSISVSNQSLSYSFGTGSSSNHSEFVNHGKF